MGRKTKQEKIIAELRRKIQSSHRPLVVTEKIPSATNIEAAKTAVQPAKGLNQTESFYVYPVQLIRKDLTKTFLLSILAISLEVALFLLLEQPLVLPFRISF